MSTTNNAEDLFQEAAREFRDSLSPFESSEFTEFASAKEMIQELKKRVSSYQKKSKLKECCQRLERVSESLSPFFDIIGIFIQSNPEVPALIWGAIRMVFLLASNFSSFLDKLLAMFEKIGNRLPGYAEYYERLLARRVSVTSEQKFPEFDIKNVPKFESPRVLRVLSHIYKDLMQFCQQACQLFSRKKRGVRYKVSAISDLFWKPFDARFKNILERIEANQALFQSEMQLEESKFTEFQFQKSQRDSRNTHEVISQIKLQLSELQKTIREQDTALTVRLAHMPDYVVSATRGTKPNNHRRSSGPERASAIFDSTFRRVFKWIDASDFARGLNKAQEVRIEDTGKWILASPSYKAFKSLETEPTKSGSEPLELQIMFIQGKPGYGKTILSSLLIEDLAKSSETDTSREPQAPSVLYYHFASEIAEECEPTHGLRACLHQLVHSNTKVASVLDIVSIISATDGTGQVRATDEDICQCLLVLLLQLPPVTLVFDGLDECSNPSELFRTVYELCHYTGVKAIFLGRPSCKLPRGCNSYTVISLEPGQNVNDIRVYLQSELDCLKNEDLLPKSSNIQDIVTSLSVRAQGMFLWARLVMRYLSNAWLSPRERADAMFDDTLPDGLENLYERIISILEGGPTTQQTKVQRIFQTIAISKTPFTLLELRQIVAVKLGQVTREDDLIVDFKKCLPIICGALVECDSSGHVHFIHSSFRDYILDRYCHGSPLAITEQSLWLNLTTICLSYLTYDIPRGAITTTGLPDERLTMLAECFPLLRYGLTRIQQNDYHIFRGSIPTTKDECDKASGILHALTEWIKQQLCVTSWIEASFAFEQVPTLEPLINMVKIWLRRYETHRIQADAVLSLFLRLEQDLIGLNSNWTEVLLKEPYAIWTSTITTFTKSSFWVESNDTIITHLGKRPASDSNNNTLANRNLFMILIKSQTAADKMTHATIYVAPSSEYIAKIERMPDSRLGIGTRSSIVEVGDHANLCSGWKALYEIKDISSQLVLFSLRLGLRTADVMEALKLPVTYDQREGLDPLKFNFPVAIIRDLSHVLILRSLVRLRSGTATGDERQMGTYAVHLQRLERRSTASSSDFKHDYESMFSPMGDAIALFEKRAPMSLSAQKLEIWSTATVPSSTSTNEYVFRGRQLFGGMRLQDSSTRAFLFHPTRPCLAFAQWGRASIWYYNETERLRQCYPLIQKTIELVSFENDEFLHYTYWGSAFGHEKFATADEENPEEKKKNYEEQEEDIASFPNGRDPSPAFGDIGPPPRYIEVIRIPAAATPQGNFGGFKPRSDDGTSVTIRQKESLATMKQEKPLRVTQEGQTGQVVKITSAGGQTAEFGHIPRLPSWEPSSLTLLPIAGSVKVIWDKESQPCYSIFDTPSTDLPSIIERTLQSVPLLEQAHSEDSRMSTTDSEGHLGESQLQLSKKRPRTEEDIAEGEPKKRVTMETVANTITDRDNV